VNAGGNSGTTIQRGAMIIPIVNHSVLQTWNVLQTSRLANGLILPGHVGRGVCGYRCNFMPPQSGHSVRNAGEERLYKQLPELAAGHMLSAFSVPGRPHDRTA
jgi:hypothetical protein